MLTIYFHAGWNIGNEELLKNLKKQTPGNEGVWDGVEAVSHPEKADYHIALNRSSHHLDPSRTLIFSMEPPCFLPPDIIDGTSAAAKFPLLRSTRPQVWTLSGNLCKSYDELISQSPPQKSQNLSWITSDIGRCRNSVVETIRQAYPSGKHGYRALPFTRSLMKRGIIGRDLIHGVNNRLLNYPSEGHVERMEFLRRLIAVDQPMDLFGRGDFDCSQYNGKIDNKWDALEEYRYSLAIENYSGENYFSEKILQPLLAWCMPIYWGCTNLSEYLPEDSYVRVDITSDDSPERVQEIIQSDYREQNLDAIREARELILYRHQMWPRVSDEINNIE